MTGTAPPAADPARFSIAEHPGGITVEVVPVGEVDAAIIDWLAPELEAVLQPLSFRTGRRFAFRKEWSGSDSTQLCSDTVLDALVAWHDSQRRDPASEWLLGVADRDLGAAGRPFVFGQATIGGCCAIVSLARLGDGDSSAGEQLALLRTRLLKEAVHELGHVAGLDHCGRGGCVMGASPDIRHADAKPSGFCAVCIRRLRARTAGPPAPSRPNSSDRPDQMT
jgi:predicted Zn-dependent protease